MGFRLRTPEQFNPNHFHGSFTYLDSVSGRVFTVDSPGYILEIFAEELRQLHLDETRTLISYAIDGCSFNVAKFAFAVSEGVQDR